MLSRIRRDIKVVQERDPAAGSAADVLLFCPGLHALWAHRLSHKLWKSESNCLGFAAKLISYIARFATGIEIHPGAVIEEDVFIDHGTGVVIGETAVVGRGCLLYQGVTLGGTGKQAGHRHPILGENVVVGAGAKVLGCIRIGENTRIGAGSVVLKNIASNSTVVGVPGRVVRSGRGCGNALEHSDLPDGEARIIINLMKRIDTLETLVDSLVKDVGSSEHTNNKSLYLQAQNLEDREILEILGGEATGLGIEEQ